MNKFKFGKNWKLFLKNITKNQFKLSKKSLLDFNKIKNFKNKSFIDIGCGSGLSSLSAKQLGAKVTSIDVDIESIECTKFLKKKFYKNDNDWKIEKLSILNTNKIKKMKKFDYVYSWGVLHHTGNLKKSLINTELLCKKKGFIHIALYNDQGKKSKNWKIIKKKYVTGNIITKKLLELFFFPFFIIKPLLKKRSIRSRGMNIYTDMIDWIGGYPFEVSKPEQIFNFFKRRNYKLINLYTCGPGHGNNEYLFEKN